MNVQQSIVPRRIAQNCYRLVQPKGTKPSMRAEMRRIDGDRSRHKGLVAGLVVVIEVVVGLVVGLVV